jgi:hypothetical protein
MALRPTEWRDDTPGALGQECLALEHEFGDGHVCVLCERGVCEMNIGETVEAMKAGNRVCRRGWNGRGMFLQYVPAQMAPLGLSAFAIPVLPFVIMRTVSGEYVPWLCSQTDLLASDWELVSTLEADGRAEVEDRVFPLPPLRGAAVPGER